MFIEAATVVFGALYWYRAKWTVSFYIKLHLKKLKVENSDFVIDGLNTEALLQFRCIHINIAFQKRYYFIYFKCTVVTYYIYTHV